MTKEQITKEEALQLLEEATYRIKHEPANYGHRGWQVGGAYWRLAKVVNDYLEPILDENEKEHADFIRENHGSSISPRNA